jgi:FAS-associated factor 2
MPGAAGAAPKLSVITALSGPPSTTTSTSSIMQLITTSIIPRTSAFLARLRRERLTLEESRHLRAEQDRAFREAATRDRERMDQQRQKEREDRQARESLERARQEKEDAVTNRKAWRRYARKHLLPKSEGPIRVALRVPASSDRNVINFTPGPSTLPLFVYAETLLIPASESPDSDPDQPPAGYTPPYDFRIVTNYPRKEIELLENGGEAVWDTIKSAGGALFAEKKENGTWGEAENGESDDEEDDD